MKDCSILGSESILGSPYLGKLLYRGLLQELLRALLGRY